MHPRIILFARAPRPGHVKTRLGLPPARAAELHEAFVRDTLEMLREFPNVELSTDAATDAWSEYTAARSVQVAGELGAKLSAAIEGALSEHPKVLILGSDSPTLPADHLRVLLATTEGAALGPTEDGGFYAICCRRSVPGMFDGVQWSTADTFASTVDALTRSGLTVEVGPRWYDVDEPADLERLRRDPNLRVHTRAVL